MRSSSSGVSAWQCSDLQWMKMLLRRQECKRTSVDDWHWITLWSRLLECQRRRSCRTDSLSPRSLAHCRRLALTAVQINQLSLCLPAPTDSLSRPCLHPTDESDHFPLAISRELPIETLFSSIRSKVDSLLDISNDLPLETLFLSSKPARFLSACHLKRITYRDTFLFQLTRKSSLSSPSQAKCPSRPCLFPTDMTTFHSACHLKRSAHRDPKFCLRIKPFFFLFAIWGEFA